MKVVVVVDAAGEAVTTDRTVVVVVIVVAVGSVGGRLVVVAGEGTFAIGVVLFDALRVVFLFGVILRFLEVAPEEYGEQKTTNKSAQSNGTKTRNDVERFLWLERTMAPRLRRACDERVKRCFDLTLHNEDYGRKGVLKTP